MPRWPRSASRRRRSGCARSTRSGARSCATPACTSTRWSIGPPSSPSCRAGRRRRRVGSARHRVLAAQARPRVSAPTRSRRTRTPARPPGPSSPTSGGARARGARLRRPRAPGDRPSSRATRTCSRGGAARCAAPARRRGPGRRPRPAPPGPAAGRAGEPDLPRRRRRPVDLRLAARRRPPGPRALDASLPGLRRVDLEVNYRCPARSSSGRSGSSSTTGSGSRRSIRAGTRRRGPAGPRAGRRRRAGPDRRACCDRGRTTTATRAVLARTNRELLPAVVVALDLGVPFRAPRIDLLVDDPGSTSSSTGSTARDGPATRPLLVALGRAAARPGATRDDRGATGARDGPARPGRAPYPDLAAFARGHRGRPEPRLAELRRDDAPLTLATAHATKGLEFDHVVVVGMEAGRFPSARAVSEAEDPGRALRGGTAARLRRLDPSPPDADAPVRPGGPLPVPARGVQRRGARGSAPRPVQLPVELAEQPVDRVEERLGQLRRQRVPDRVLRPVGRPARIAVARSPAGSSSRSRSGSGSRYVDPAARRRARGPRRAAGRRDGPRPGRLVDGRALVRGPPGDAPRRRPSGSVIRRAWSRRRSRRPPRPAARAGAAAGACARSR